MRRLDRRVAREEQRRVAEQTAIERANEATRQRRAAREEAVAAAELKQKVKLVEALMGELLGLLEARDYPHMQTVQFPSTRWWRSSERKAVWKLYGSTYSGYREVVDYEMGTRQDSYTQTDAIYLLPSGKLIYRSESRGLGATGEDLCEEWSGQYVSSLERTVRMCIEWMRERGQWPSHMIH